MSKKNTTEKIDVKQVTILREACEIALRENPITSTQELMDICRDKGLFQDKLYEEANRKSEQSAVLMAISTIKDDKGNRLVHGITLANPITGKSDNVLYQDSLFNLSHYQIFIPRVAMEGRNKTKKAKHLNDDCIGKFNTDVGKQLEFDFNGVCDAFGLTD